MRRHSFGRGLMFRFTVAILSLFIVSCQSTHKVTEPAPSTMRLFDPNAVNSPEAQNQPYVILISLDGYRYDYNKMHGAENLSRLATEGVESEGLRPSYPSKTFPNHYTIVTGMRPDHHGIVSNEFYDPARDAVYSLPDK